MDNLITASQEMMMSSKEIATLTEKQHKHVIRDIRVMIDELDIDGPVLGYVENTDSRGYTAEFRLNKELTETLITGYSIKLRRNVIRRLNELEQKNKQPVIPQNFADALQLAADQARQLELAAPKVAFVDKYIAADSGSKGFRQVAKLLKANEKEFRAFLSDSKIMYKLGNEWMPYQQHTEAGRFEVKGGVADNDHVYNSALFTPKGINWIAGLWAQHCLKNGDTER